MREIWILMKKEFARFFQDKRLVFTTLLLPGLLIYVVYSFLGNSMMERYLPDETYVPTVYVVNALSEDTAGTEGESEQALLAALGEMDVNWQHISENEKELALLALAEKTADAVVVFPENFFLEVMAVSAPEGAVNVEIYYNSAETESYYFYQELAALLKNYEESLFNLVNVNAGEEAYDFATDEDSTALIVGAVLPLLLMSFLFSGCVSVAPASIAGEKEHGTMATLLVTPVKRSSIALGKIFSLSVLALLSGLSGFLGTMLSLPALTGGQLASVTGSDSVYGGSDYVALLLVICSTVLLLVSMISLISAFAKTTREASAAASPFMVLSMVASVLPSLSSSGGTDVLLCLIPIYNAALCMYQIFTFAWNISGVAVCVGSNIVYSCVLAFLLARVFHSEKMMA